MEANEIKVKVRTPINRTFGQSLEVIAQSSTGMILALVELQIPLQVGDPLAKRIGADAENQIIEDAKALARRIAEGVIRPVVGA